MHGAFCDQPWPGNEAGGDPGLSRTVGSGDTADAAHTVRLPFYFAWSLFFMPFAKLLCRHFAEEEEIQQNAK